MVITDIGGEKTKRFKTELPDILSNARLDYVWRNRNYKYIFKSLLSNQGKNWDNKSLLVDGKSLFKPCNLTQEMADVIMLLLHGGAALNPGLPGEILDKCILGSMLGNKPELDKFVRQRYIWVSKITGGATSNAMGHLAEEYVKEQLQHRLPNWDFSKKSIRDISQNEGRTNINFDIVAESPNGTCCAIELSFQVTTNSVIERKSGQAQSRQRLLHKNGHYIAYILDGAGNFERESALGAIMQYSDCSVTFKKDEIERLAVFLSELENNDS